MIHSSKTVINSFLHSSTLAPLDQIPLFLRGEAGSWDQGAIWWGEVLPWKNKLYMFYEGWGSLGFTPSRNSNYYYPGHSQIGRADCTTNQFLEWAFSVSKTP